MELDPPEVESATDNVIPPTPTPGTSSQTPVTDPNTVSSKSVRSKPKGRAAKRARIEESAMNSNTAATYLDVEVEEPVSAKNRGIPAYLLKPAPTVLLTEDLRKHVMISDIEKNRALTRLANKLCGIIPSVHSVLRRLDPTETNNTSDHLYQTQD